MFIFFKNTFRFYRINKFNYINIRKLYITFTFSTIIFFGYFLLKDVTIKQSDTSIIFISSTGNKLLVKLKK